MSVQHPHDTVTAKNQAIHEENIWLPGLFLNNTHAAGIFRPSAGKAERGFHFLSDDLGYGDLGCYGETKVQTGLFNRSSIHAKLSPENNSMKTNLTLSLVVICLIFTSSEIIAQEKKGETLHGVIESVDGNNITVNYRRKSRAFRLHDNAKITYVSFLQEKKEIQPGFFVRAGVDSEGQCHQLWVTLPIPEEGLKPSAEMLTMTPAELYQLADSNGDGELSYVEYATAIYRSPKHGPVGFTKFDKDKSGTLNLQEFAAKLEDIKWWRISRKTPAEWHADADANSDGVLSKQEFVTFLGSTAHIDIFFKRADKDRSGDLSIADLAGFIDSILK